MVANLDIPLAVLALATFIPVPLLQSLRLVWMLRVQDIRIGYWLAVKLSFAGNLLNFVVLGSIGGDLYKAYYLTKHTLHKTEAVTTIFVDRLVGLTSLILLVGVVTLPPPMAIVSGGATVSIRTQSPLGSVSASSCSGSGGSMFQRSR